VSFGEPPSDALKRFILYLVQRSVETTHSQQAVTVAAHLQTLGLPEIWGCHSDADVDSGLLGRKSV
jgi:hypothetical protein